MISIEYLAGLFDGEGYVGVDTSNGNFILRCTITNTHLEVLQRIQEIFGGKINAHDSVKSGRPERRNCYRLSWYGMNAKDILARMNPYVIIKKQQLDIAFHFPLNPYRTYKSELVLETQSKIYAKLKALKDTRVSIPEIYTNLAVLEHSEYLRKKQQAIDLRKSHPDYSIRQIAAEMKVSSTMVHKYLKDSGVTTKKAGYGDGVKGKLVYTYRKTPRVEKKEELNQEIV